MFENFAILKQVIEIAAIGLDVGRVEDRAEYPLYILDVLADADFRAGFRLDVRCARQMIRMGVGFQRPHNGQLAVRSGFQDRFNRTRIHLARLGIVVQHRIDHRALSRRRVGDEIADRVGGFVEEGLDVRGGSHGSCLSIFELGLTYYISRC